jgi:hypothetical protein
MLLPLLMNLGMFTGGVLLTDGDTGYTYPVGAAALSLATGVPEVALSLATGVPASEPTYATGPPATAVTLAFGVPSSDPTYSYGE